MDKNSIIKGLHVGSLITGMRRVTKKPVAFLYNDVRLPPMPEWNMEMHPYVYIHKTSASQYYRLMIKAEVEYADNDGYWSIVVQPGEKYYRCKSGENVWEEAYYDASEDIYYQPFGTWAYKIAWANFDVLNEDGTLYLEASDPIPVYE